MEEKKKKSRPIFKNTHTHHESLITLQRQNMDIQIIEKLSKLLGNNLRITNVIAHIFFLLKKFLNIQHSMNFNLTEHIGRDSSECITSNENQWTNMSHQMN